MSEQVIESLDGKPIRIQIMLPTNAYFMSGIRDFTLSFIQNTTELGDKWAYRFQSIVDELCNNAIEFGSAEGEDIIFTLTYVPSKHLEIIVEDSGTGKSHMNAEEIMKLIQERKQPTYVNNNIRGRGLTKIVDEWSDELNVFDRDGGGLTFRAVKYLNEDDLEKSTLEKDAEMLNADQQIQAGHVKL